MKAFEIWDKDQNRSVGCLLYYEKEHSFVIELEDDLDEWSAPILFAKMVQNGRFTASRERSMQWVCERIIPGDRQNIANILVNEGMDSYDEFALLVKSRGECSQDAMYIRELNEIPGYINERMMHNIVECVTCADNKMLLFFKDGTVRKVGLDECSYIEGVDKVIANEKLFRSAHIAAGGYCVTFNESIDVPAADLYDKGMAVPLSIDDFVSFVIMNIVDSSGASNLLECSRQNLQYLVANNFIKPVKKGTKGNLYLKGEVLASRK